MPVLDGEALSMRVIVDHSIVQSFAMGGRSTATSRVYPTEAIYAAAGVYLFNNATGAGVTAERVVVHQMDTSAYDEIAMAGGGTWWRRAGTVTRKARWLGKGRRCHL